MTANSAKPFGMGQVWDFAQFSGQKCNIVSKKPREQNLDLTLHLFGNIMVIVRQVKKTILSTTGEVVELVIGYKRCDYFSLSFSSTDYPEV